MPQDSPNEDGSHSSYINWVHSMVGDVFFKSGSTENPKPKLIKAVLEYSLK